MLSAVSKVNNVLKVEDYSLINSQTGLHEVPTKLFLKVKQGKSVAVLGPFRNVSGQRRVYFEGK